MLIRRVHYYYYSLKKTSDYSISHLFFEMVLPRTPAD
jgi:hypothetical protein